MVDLQVCREACLTTDLAVFLYTSTDHLLRSAHLDKLLQTYHESLLHFLAILRTPAFPNFTLEELKARFHRAKIYGFAMALISLSIVLTNPEKATDMDQMGQKNSNGTVGDFTQLIEKVGVKEAEDKSLFSLRIQGMIKELYEEGVL